ncbi:neprilysin-3 isoform X2 [Eupeodes corollae]|uniref:neprilysin-3 isoform X2 n=1 Tax=Eupeodes corollae TaxID=290404 RepID=UPI00248F9462|nr:neprilysin-3 isoform X2 [Eupeodes corollae]XP_055922190.1 neprilysin-3 isoform X2 [Eupeodes corollae]
MMTRYKHADFQDDDTSSTGAIQLTESNSSSGYHLRYHTSRATSKWRSRNKLERCLIITTGLMAATILVLITLIVVHSHDNTTRILHVQPHNTKTFFHQIVPQTSPPKLRQLLPVVAENRKPFSKNKTTVEKQLVDDIPLVSSSTASSSPSPSAGPCLNKYCIFAASDILKSLDMTIDPCEDFYGFACNQWIRKNPLPDGKSVWGTFGKLEMRNQMVIRNILEKPFSYFKSEAEKKAKLYYQSCMDEDEYMDKLGGEPMLDFIREVGGWNISTHDFRIDKWSMELTLKMLQNRYNMGGFFSWAIGEDDKNSSNHVIQIDQGGLALPTREHYLNTTIHEKVRIAYLEYMTKIGVLLGGEETNVRQQMKDVLEFETQIASITAPAEERRNEEAMYHFMSLREVDAMAPFINFTAHFADALQTIGRKITQDERVIVYAPEFLKNLSTLVQEYQKTEKGRIALNNYLVWQGVRTLTTCLSKPFRDAYKGVRKALLGSDGTEETWRYCVSDTNNVIGFAVGAIFVRETFQGDAKPQAEKMIDEVRDAFKKNLRNIPWMDVKTRKKAEEKADAITDMIGFPEYILNTTQLDEKYKDLHLNSTEYFNNNLRINQFNLKKNLEKLDTPVNKSGWGMTPSTVNAYYTPTKNQIVFPAGILQKPFYDVNNPKSFNYGAMGVVMGHELTHAFDDQGREYDKYGNLNKWWEPKSIERFVEQTDCIIKQYGDFEVIGMNLNGKQTVGENIADNGGLKAAFNAYISSKNEKEADYLSLPGLNLTHRQLFFVSFAQVWCSAITDEAATLQIEKDPHAPPEYRVIGPLSNLKEFSKEFKCPLGSRMNPRKKCEVW